MLMRFAPVVGAVAGAVVGMVGPASAAPLNGSYAATMIDGGGRYERGGTTIFTVTPCGPDCRHLDTGAGPPSDLHLQRNIWSGPFGAFDAGGAPCTAMLDNASLVLTSHCPGRPNLVIRLTKNP